ncbi:MAG TPA: hypothetical protein VGS22_19855 [Thermoanaerobaculia bacterium]|jgi:hypothetical protein|nr:hypothetical protein [Thermoanaerobaculia bacterium]
MLENLTIDSFADHKGSGFRLVAAENVAFDMTLAEVTSLGDSGVRQAFSLIFHSPAGAPIVPQRIYRLEHAELGELDLFVVPLGPKGGVFRYEVIFT